MRVAHEGVISEPLSDEEHDVLRVFAGALVVPPQDRVVGPRRDHGLPTSEHSPKTLRFDAPQERMLISETVVASHNPERKLS